ncbi:MAG: tetratricopeptide repeat protein [Syntrophales bacterium]|nr:tetratricopeptide repeat protein [Syntrophales bacterium]MDD5641201.1 tetratricopeptide repeat protein [Syntrophales bacterium]
MALTLILAGWGCGPSSAPSKTEKASKVSLSPQAKEHLHQGQKLLAEKKFAEAVKEFQEATRLSPDSALAYYWLGRGYFYRQDKEQAEKAFQQALQLDPKHYLSMISLGRLYSLDLKKLDQAEKLLLQALDESPDNLEGRFVLGVVYGLKRNKQKALNEFNFTFAKEGELALYHFEIGRILESTGDKKPALAHYRRALVLNPKLAVAQEAAKRLEADPGKKAASKAQSVRKPGKTQRPEKKPAS